MNENTKVIPVNREGCLELGMSPCSICDVGWGHWSTNETKTCRDTCDYLKRYMELLMKQKG